jgi:hypothetical protein
MRVSASPLLLSIYMIYLPHYSFWLLLGARNFTMFHLEISFRVETLEETKETFKFHFASICQSKAATWSVVVLWISFGRSRSISCIILSATKHLSSRNWNLASEAQELCCNNTRTMLSRRHIGDPDNDRCALCDTGTDETIDHLFFSCPFARECCTPISFSCNLTLTMDDRLMQARSANAGNSLLRQQWSA